MLLRYATGVGVGVTETCHRNETHPMCLSLVRRHRFFQEFDGDRKICLGPCVVKQLGHKLVEIVLVEGLLNKCRSSGCSSSGSEVLDC